MTILEEAMLEVVSLLEELHLPYILIGGAAVGLWEEPRSTLDVDFTIWIEPDRLETIVEVFSKRLVSRTSRPLEFALSRRVLPVRASNGVQVDLLFAHWPLEKQAIDRAVLRRIAGVDIRLAPLDYLLYLKLVSDRPKDYADAEALMHRHRGRIDLDWLRTELTALSEALAEPDILARFQRLSKEDD